MIIAYVGLGANVGEPRSQVESALRELAHTPAIRLIRASSLYRSAPLGYSDQPDFVNAVAQVETELSPERLLAALHAIEERHGRTRSFPNAPRPLDLDLLLYGKEEISAPGLAVPHPRMHERAFVLKPLLELAPDAAIPGRGPVRALLATCQHQAVDKMEG